MTRVINLFIIYLRPELEPTHTTATRPTHDPSPPDAAARRLMSPPAPSPLPKGYIYTLGKGDGAGIGNVIV